LAQQGWPADGRPYGLLYGLGVFLASFSADKLWWLYLSYGVIGGVGLGFGYIAPCRYWSSGFPTGGG
jgi:MFS transporter, OFA family, oxalate/formate antiporter